MKTGLLQPSGLEEESTEERKSDIVFKYNIRAF